jgi:hypothetical protein
VSYVWDSASDPEWRGPPVFFMRCFVCGQEGDCASVRRWVGHPDGAWDGIAYACEAHEDPARWTPDEEQLHVRGLEVLVVALVLSGEEVALPDVGEPLPSPAFVTRRSKAYESPVGSASCGVGSPSIRQRSMKCDCDEAFSVVVTPRHFFANSPGVSVGCVIGSAISAMRH